jgi:dipeptidase
MCDTLVAVGKATADGTVILAKNSDREPNEAHVLTHLPRARHEAGATVKCTYIEIPQVPETYEVLLSKPFWIWGCEMGANECGVAIGNEAVFTKEPYDKGPGLIGMDFIRLALERADTARKALDLMVELLATYGQGGNCGLHNELYYHNSFIIADPDEAWVLETADKFWAAERVHDVRSISNGLTIGREWDLAAPGLVEHAVEKGWCKSRDDFHFARCYSEFLRTRLVGCRTRQRRSTDLLKAQLKAQDEPLRSPLDRNEPLRSPLDRNEPLRSPSDRKSHVTVETMMSILRDHGDTPNAWTPGQGLLMNNICVHASFGPTRPSQSTGSFVAHLAPDLPTYWLTGTSAPCTGIFKPVYLGGVGLPDLGPEPNDTYDPQSLWWTHERLHRAVIRDYTTRLPLYEEERDTLEATFLSEADEVYERNRGRSAEKRATRLAAFTRSCFKRAAAATAHWTERVSSTPVQRHPPRLFSIAWDRFDREAGLTQGR